MNLTPSSLGAKIITDYVKFFYYKIQRGDVTMSQPILKAMFEVIDPRRLIKFHVSLQTIYYEIKYLERKTTYDVLVEYFLEWNKGDHLAFSKIQQKNSDLFVSNHSIGSNLSEVQCKTYAMHLRWQDRQC